MLQQRLLVYQRYITSPRQALLHLLLHCCHKDGECSQKELVVISNIMVNLYGEGSQCTGAEMAAYHRYARIIKDDVQYLQFLLHYIKPSQRLVLLWHCIQVVVADHTIALSEELLVTKLAVLLHIHPEECNTLYKLALQAQAGSKETVDGR